MNLENFDKRECKPPNLHPEAAIINGKVKKYNLCIDGTSLFPQDAEPGQVVCVVDNVFMKYEPRRTFQNINFPVFSVFYVQHNESFVDASAYSYRDDKTDLLKRTCEAWNKEVARKNREIIKQHAEKLGLSPRELQSKLKKIKQEKKEVVQTQRKIEIVTRLKTLQQEVELSLQKCSEPDRTSANIGYSNSIFESRKKRLDKAIELLKIFNK